MHQLEIEGVSVRTAVPNTTELLRSRTILLALPGATANASMFDALIKSWNAQGMTIAAIDYPGHGEGYSPAVLREQRLEDYVQAVRVVCDAFPVGSGVSLLGHSMGGIIAQAVAAKRPIDNLVLLASAAPWFTGGMRLKFLLRRGWIDLARGLPCGQFQFELAHERYVRGLLEHNDFLEMLESLQPEALRAVWEMSFGYRFARQALQPRTLVVSGEYDRLMSMRSQRELASRYGAEHQILNAGHVLPLEPAFIDWSDWVLDWLWHEHQ